MNKNIYKELVLHFGTQTKASVALGISQPTISGYINGRWSMSPIAAMRVEEETQGRFKAKDLCPSLYEHYNHKKPQLRQITEAFSVQTSKGNEL